MFYGSSAEHTVHCLDAYSGKEKWVFFTDGPVRFAPSIHDGRVYAGSDDGTAYCLDAATGKLIWTHTAASEKNKLVPNDGRLVSPWSVRSSIAVDAGTAYFTSGFFPHEGVYMSAVDALTGRSHSKPPLETVSPQQRLVPGLHAPVELPHLHAGRPQHAVLF